MNDPKDYKAIKAWGSMLGSRQYYITEQQRKAALQNAPLDALFESEDGWMRLSHVSNQETLEYFRKNHPELLTKAKED